MLIVRLLCRDGFSDKSFSHRSQVLPNVTFKTREGKMLLIVANDSAIVRSVKIPYHGQ